MLAWERRDFEVVACSVVIGREREDRSGSAFTASCTYVNFLLTVFVRRKHMQIRSVFATGEMAHSCGMKNILKKSLLRTAFLLTEWARRRCSTTHFPPLLVVKASGRYRVELMFLHLQVILNR